MVADAPTGIRRYKKQACLTFPESANYAPGIVFRAAVTDVACQLNYRLQTG